MKTPFEEFCYNIKMCALVIIVAVLLAKWGL